MPILRAGLGMVQAIQEIVPLTEVAHVGLRRDDATLRSEVYLTACPATSAAGGSSCATPCSRPAAPWARYAGWCGTAARSEMIALCILASAPGLATFGADHPGVHVYCAAVDPDLNDAGFIVPGLGDAGDRLFGPPD